MISTEINFPSVDKSLGTKQSSFTGTVYFSNDILCEGDVLKIVIDRHGLFDEQLRVRITEHLLSESQEVVLDGVLSPVWSEAPRLIITTIRFDQVGSYTAVIYDPVAPNEPLQTQNLVVLETEIYSKYWSELIGDEKPQAYFWDQLEASNINDLLIGLPVDPFLAILSERVTLDGTGLARNFGALLYCLMGLNPEFIPFNVDIKNDFDGVLPHLDLSVVLWALQLVAPIWTEAAIYVKSANLTCEVSADTVKLRFTYQSTRVKPSKRLPTEIIDDLEKLPYSFQLLKQVLSESWCELNYHRYGGFGSAFTLVFRKH